MSEQESNICEICGGVKRIEYVIGFEEGRPRDMRVESPSLPEGEWRLCPGHPESAQKHDGKLDEHNRTRILLDLEDNQVHIEDVWTDGISLEPKQALSLLAWLKQEEAELQRLAKEQSGE